jgi:hypothetical protein
MFPTANPDFPDNRLPKKPPNKIPSGKPAAKIAKQPLKACKTAADWLKIRRA